MIPEFLTGLAVEPQVWQILLIPVVVLTMLTFFSSFSRTDSSDGVATGVSVIAIFGFMSADLFQTLIPTPAKAVALSLALLGLLLFSGLRRSYHPFLMLLRELGGALLGCVVAWFAVTGVYAGDFSPMTAAWILGLPIMQTLAWVVQRPFLDSRHADAGALYPHRLLQQFGCSPPVTMLILLGATLLLGVIGVVSQQQALQDRWRALALLCAIAAYILVAGNTARRWASPKSGNVEPTDEFPAHGSEQTLILEAGRADKNYWRDLWRYRELFLILAWRDIAVRYKQTMIGVAWAIVRPFLTMVVFTVIFGHVAKLPTDGNAPYALLVFAAMLPWTLFSSSLGDAANSLIGNANLISKVYFPRLIVPAATLVTAFVDFLVSFVILMGLMIYYQFAPSWNILLLPIFILLALLSSLGPGLWITALNVKYRDFRYIIPFISQFGLYVSPVGFSSHVIPGQWRLLYSLNPMVGVIDGFRWCILGGADSPIYWPGFLLSLTIVALFLWLGVSQFRKMEKTFADLI